MKVALTTHVELAKSRPVPWDEARAARVARRIRTARRPSRVRLQATPVIMGSLASITLVALVLRAATAPRHPAPGAEPAASRSSSSATIDSALFADGGYEASTD